MENKAQFNLDSLTWADEQEINTIFVAHRAASSGRDTEALKANFADMENWLIRTIRHIPEQYLIEGHAPVTEAAIRDREWLRHNLRRGAVAKLLAELMEAMYEPEKN